MSSETKRFWGTIELLSGGRAVITLTTEHGEWLCAGRIDGHNRYDRGYELLSRAAADKGGTLDRYSRVKS